MKPHELVLFCLAWWLLSGCFGHLKAELPRPPTVRTTAAFEVVLDSWVGVDATALAKQLGVPHSDFDLPDGTTLWEYRWDRSYTTPISTYTVHAPGRSTTTYNSWTDSLETTHTAGASTSFQSGGQTVRVTCTVTFAVSRAGKVASYKKEGNACKLVPRPEPIDCLLRGEVFKVIEISPDVGRGTAGKYVSLVPLTGGLIHEDSFVVKTGKGRDYAALWGQDQLVIACLSSGVGPYLLTYPERKIVLGHFSR